MFYGGDLNKHESFKYILSIGYEFETHDLAKLSLLNDSILINSTITTRDMKIRLLSNNATKIDNNNYQIIDKHIDKSLKDILIYNEYFDEYDGIVDDNTVLNITNDIGSSNFDKILIKHCLKFEDKNKINYYDEDIKKNTFYKFKSLDGKIYDINFNAKLLNRNCSVFSGVEYVMTYFKLKKSTNIILETFLNTCYRIFKHLHNLEKIPGELLFMNDTKIGKYMEKRILFHKPNTNLYYLQTHDVDEYSIESTIGMTTFIPQMTFRANIKNIIQIMKDIVENKNTIMLKRRKQIAMDEYQIINNIEKCMYELFNEYNKNANKNMKINKKLITETIGYLFMIFYKIYMYIESYISSDLDDEENYFKNHLSFAPRHSNLLFYEKIKKILFQKFKSNTVSVIIKLLNQPSIISKYLYFDKKQALNIILQENDINYGNPAYSFISYFNHFENPNTNNNTLLEKEWLIYSETDIFSTTFELPDDNLIIIENRLFFIELILFAKNELNIYAPNSFTLNNLKNMYKKLIKSVKDLSKQELNPITMQYVNKCKETQRRNDKFICVNKKTKKTKKNKNL